MHEHKMNDIFGILDLPIPFVACITNGFLEFFHLFLFLLCRSQQIQQVLLSIGHILSGCRSTAPHMNMTGLLGVAAVKEWRSVMLKIISLSLFSLEGTKH